MKILIVVSSEHRENTLKIAEAMSEAAPVTVTDLDNVEKYNLQEYDIVGFGSGIYYGKHSKKLIKLALNATYGDYCFVFCTSGSKKFDAYNAKFAKMLENRGKTVLGSFGCLGLDKFFIFALFGGLNKTHPDIDDFEAAQQFICKTMQKYLEIKK